MDVYSENLKQEHDFLESKTSNGISALDKIRLKMEVTNERVARLNRQLQQQQDEEDALSASS